MTENYYRILELLLLFVCLPLSFLWSYPIVIKGGLGGIGFVYILYCLYQSKMLTLEFPLRSRWNPFLKEIFWKFLIIAIITILYVNSIAPEKLFKIVLEKPLLWVFILFVYTFLSVWPQELVYRSFFFYRYQPLLSNPWLFILINAFLFSLAHIFLKNLLVLLLTFVGGVLFAYTYYKKKSTTLVSIEHALYGNLLFTVGMGEMLAFPS